MGMDLKTITSYIIDKRMNLSFMKIYILTEKVDDCINLRFLALTKTISYF